MAFVALYVERAAESEPATWRGLTEPRVARTMSELWGQAEKTMVSSCGIPNFGTEDKALIRQFCQRGPQAALQKDPRARPRLPSRMSGGNAGRGARNQAARRHDADWQHPRSGGYASSVLEPRSWPRPGALRASVAAALRPQVHDADSS